MPDAVTWQAHSLPLPNLDLAWYDAGNGPTVVFLHGGPGDDSSYLRPVAAPLTGRFHCVLYDQRGGGGSRLARYDGETLHIARFVADIEALRRELGGGPVSLVGHSWGANLALHYAAAHPQGVRSVALVAMGPLNEELGAVAAANLLKPLTVAEREEWSALRAQRRAALERGDHERVRECFLRQLPLGTRGWFFSPEALARFLAAYDYVYTPEVGKHLLPTAARVPLLDHLAGFAAPVLVLYGYQDFEPITQAYLLRERLPQSHLRFLNECGHVPWLEQPERFYAALTDFLVQSPSE